MRRIWALIALMPNSAGEEWSAVAVLRVVIEAMESRIDAAMKFFAMSWHKQIGINSPHRQIGCSPRRKAAAACTDADDTTWWNALLPGFNGNAVSWFVGTIAPKGVSVFLV